MYTLNIVVKDLAHGYVTRSEPEGRQPLPQGPVLVPVKRIFHINRNQTKLRAQRSREVQNITNQRYVELSTCCGHSMFSLDG